MKTLQPTEYMYASARIRALEKHLVGRERMEALIEARSADEVMERLASFGLVPAEDASTDNAAAEAAHGPARERMLTGILHRAYAEVEAAVPDPAVFRYFRYPYDGNNLKAAIKCAIRGISAEGMLFDFGTVPAGRVEALLREGQVASAFPPAMAAAVQEARAAYDRTGDPQQIDAILDRACYADMLRAATASGDETLIGWLRAKIDLVNILICLRILRMKRGAIGAELLSNMLLPGGTLETRFFTDAYTAGEAGLWAALAPTPYAVLARVEGEPRPLYAVEKAADDYRMALVRDGARTPFGAAVAGGYLVGCEASVQNIRIVLAAKDAGLSTDTLRERIRVSYV